MLSFDKGTKVKQGVISIINLHGTWREMGRQYGFLMSEELADLYNRGIIGHLVEEQE